MDFENAHSLMKAAKNYWTYAVAGLSAIVGGLIVLLTDAQEFLAALLVATPS